jgi:hypothetical protein
MPADMLEKANRPDGEMVLLPLLPGPPPLTAVLCGWFRRWDAMPWGHWKCTRGMFWPGRSNPIDGSCSVTFSTTDVESLAFAISTALMVAKCAGSELSVGGRILSVITASSYRTVHGLLGLRSKRRWPCPPKMSVAQGSVSWSASARKRLFLLRSGLGNESRMFGTISKFDT